MKKLLFLTSFLLSSFIIGCGSNSNHSSNFNSLETLDKDVTIANSKVELVPSMGINVNKKEAYTFSELGILESIKFPKAEEVKESNETVTQVIEDIFKSKKNIYSITSAKVVKKPFTSFDGKLAVLFKFNPKLKFDTTVSVTNYLSLLALPNNGLDALKNGLKPIPEISGDIAFYNSTGERKLDINKDFKFSDTNVSVYLLFKDVNLTEGKYKLYTYDYNGSYKVKDIEINKTNKNIVVAMNKISSFVIAKPDNNISEINTTLSLPLPMGLKVGIVALNGNEVVGVGKLKYQLLNNEANQDDGVAFKVVTLANIYTIKQPTKYVYVSYFLKNGKKEVTNLKNLSIDDFYTEKYPLNFEKLSQNDKKILSSIYNYQNYLFNWNELLELLYPGKLFVDEYDINGTFKIYNFIESYLLENKCESFNDEYNVTENVTLSYSCNDSLLKLSITYINDDYTKIKTISITRNTDSKFKINYIEKVDEESESLNYILNLEPYGRVVKEANRKYLFSWKDIQSGKIFSFNETLKYIGDNNYLYNYNENFSQYYKTDENTTKKLSYRVIGTAQLYFNIDKNFTSLKQHTYEVFDINSNEENITITGKNFVYEYLPTQEVIVNGNPINTLIEEY